jgi:hypothetical protein
MHTTAMILGCKDNNRTCPHTGCHFALRSLCVYVPMGLQRTNNLKGTHTTALIKLHQTVSPYASCTHTVIGYGQLHL